MRRVLSLWQPWATFCVINDPLTDKPAKEFETRHWQPRQPRPIDIAIHATKKLEAWLLDIPEIQELHRRLSPMAFHRGAIIGVATIAEILETEELVPPDGIAEISRIEFELGDYSPGRFAWRLANVIALPNPIPFKGRQEALYILDPAVERQIDEQLAEATI